MSEEEQRGVNDQLSAGVLQLLESRANLGGGSTLLIGSKRTNQWTEFYHAPKYQKYSEYFQLQGVQIDGQITK